MRRIVLLLASMALAVLLACGVALALPSETPDQTPMVNGTVRAIEQVGTKIWVGGKFTQVKQCNDSANALSDSNVAVFDSQSNNCKDTTNNYSVLLRPHLSATSRSWRLSRRIPTQPIPRGMAWRIG